MKSGETWMELHVLHKHGWSISALAREFGLNWRTVKKIVAQSEPRPRRPAPRPMPTLDPVVPFIHEILEAVVARVPSPAGDPAAPLQALIFDSWYDNFRGVIILVRVVQGMISRGLPSSG